MEIKEKFTTTIKRKVFDLLKTIAIHILFFGGSRSGKTVILVIIITFRAAFSIMPGTF